MCHLVSEVVAEAVVEVLTSDRTWPQRHVKLPAKGECVRVFYLSTPKSSSTYLYVPAHEGGKCCLDFFSSLMSSIGQSQIQSTSPLYFQFKNADSTHGLSE